MLTIEFFHKSSVSVNETLFYNKHLENGYFSLTFKVLYKEVPRRYRSSLLIQSFVSIGSGKLQIYLLALEFCFHRSREDADLIC